MNKRAKIIFAIFLAALVIGGIWFYAEHPMSLLSLVPHPITRVQITVFTNGAEIIEDVMLEGEEVAPIAVTLNASRVTRAPKTNYVSDQNISLRLYPDDGYPTLIIVNSDGRIAFAEELDLDHYRYYEGGADLFQALWLIYGE